MDEPSRNGLQTTTLLDAISEHGFDAAFGGARRDEERARAKERVFSFRDDFGQWDPRRQRPELWDIYNGRVRKGEHVRVFPLSNWTELDVWEYIRVERLELPPIYFAHEREVFERDGMLYAASEFLPRQDGEDAVRGVGALPHGRRHDVHGRRALTTRRRSTTWCRRSPRRGSPSAARRAPTIASARPPWRTASEWGTSSHAQGRHRRIGRRRQVDADRPPAARLQVADGRRDGHRRRPRAAHRRPARRARAGHHDRRRVPPLRHAATAVRAARLPRTRAVHAQHGHGCIDRRPRAGARRRAPRDDRAVAPPPGDRGAARRAGRDRAGEQDGPRRASPRTASTRSCAR